MSGDNGTLNCTCAAPGDQRGYLHPLGTGPRCAVRPLVPTPSPPPSPQADLDGTEHFTPDELEYLRRARQFVRRYARVNTPPSDFDVVDEGLSLAYVVIGLTRALADQRSASPLPPTPPTPPTPPPPPPLEIKSGSTVYMCGHHEVVFRRTGRAGSVSVTGTLYELGRLVDVVNRWYGATPVPADADPPVDPEPCD